jgi:hypothetical protein
MQQSAAPGTLLNELSNAGPRIGIAAQPVRGAFGDVVPVGAVFQAPLQVLGNASELADGSAACGWFAALIGLAAERGCSAAILVLPRTAVVTELQVYVVAAVVPWCARCFGAACGELASFARAALFDDVPCVEPGAAALKAIVYATCFSCGARGRITIPVVRVAQVPFADRDQFPAQVRKLAPIEPEGLALGLVGHWALTVSTGPGSRVAKFGRTAIGQVFPSGVRTATTQLGIVALDQARSAGSAGASGGVALRCRRANSLHAPAIALGVAQLKLGTDAARGLGGARRQASSQKLLTRLLVGRSCVTQCGRQARVDLHQAIARVRAAKQLSTVASMHAGGITGAFEARAAQTVLLDDTGCDVHALLHQFPGLARGAAQQTGLVTLELTLVAGATRIGIHVAFVLRSALLDRNPILLVIADLERSARAAVGLRNTAATTPPARVTMRFGLAGFDLAPAIQIGAAGVQPRADAAEAPRAAQGRRSRGLVLDDFEFAEQRVAPGRQGERGKRNREPGFSEGFRAFHLGLAGRSMGARRSSQIAAP